MLRHKGRKQSVLRTPGRVQRCGFSAVVGLGKRLDKKDNHLIADGDCDHQKDQLKRRDLDRSAEFTGEELLNKRTVQATSTGGATAAAAGIAFAAIAAGNIQVGTTAFTGVASRGIGLPTFGATNRSRAAFLTAMILLKRAAGRCHRVTFSIKAGKRERRFLPGRGNGFSWELHRVEWERSLDHSGGCGKKGRAGTFERWNLVTFLLFR